MPVASVSELGTIKRKGWALYVWACICSVRVIWTEPSRADKRREALSDNNHRRLLTSQLFSPLWWIISRPWWFTIKQTMNPLWQPSYSPCTVSLYTGDQNSRAHYGNWRHRYKSAFKLQMGSLTGIIWNLWLRVDVNSPLHLVCYSRFKNNMCAAKNITSVFCVYWNMPVWMCQLSGLLVISSQTYILFRTSWRNVTKWTRDFFKSSSRR